MIETETILASPFVELTQHFIRTSYKKKKSPHLKNPAVSNEEERFVTAVEEPARKH